jgi:hypothetical protein
MVHWYLYCRVAVFQLGVPLPSAPARASRTLVVHLPELLRASDSAWLWCPRSLCAKLPTTVPDDSARRTDNLVEKRVSMHGGCLGMIMV